MTPVSGTLADFDELREIRFGHVGHAVTFRLLAAPAGRAPLVVAEPSELVLVDIDNLIIKVHGHAKEGASFGYTRVRGLDTLLATARPAT